MTTLHVLRCVGLTDEDPFGKNDPYVVVKGSNGDVLHKTQPIEEAGSKCEFKDASVTFDSADAAKDVTIQIFDKDITDDDIIGSTVVSIPDTAEEGAIEMRIDLKNASDSSVGAVIIRWVLPSRKPSPPAAPKQKPRKPASTSKASPYGSQPSKASPKTKKQKSRYSWEQSQKEEPAPVESEGSGNQNSALGETSRRDLLMSCRKEVEKTHKTSEGSIRKLEVEDVNLLHSVLKDQVRTKVRLGERSQVPGPGKYDPKSAPSKPSVLTPRIRPETLTRIEDRQESRIHPGPGAYVLPQTLSKISAPLIGRQQPSQLKAPVFMVPGPGQYDAVIEPIGSKSKDLIVSIKSPRNFQRNYALREAATKPGPGTYDHSITHRGRAMLGSETTPDPAFQPRRLNQPYDPLPGPGAHPVPRWPQTSRAH